MSKPINKTEFWKERIETAQKEHYSVYVCGEDMWKNINKVHETIIEREIKPSETVLDAGCGYGRWCEIFDNNKYFGVDFSPDFIKKAQEKYPEYLFAVKNLKDLQIKDKSFDWAICVSIKKMVVDNLGEEEWNLMLKELKRVARKVLVLEYEDPEPFEII